MTTVTFYHSVICPRCQWASRSLDRLLPDFPHLSIERIEYLTNLGRSRRDGVRGIPTLISGDRQLSGFLLTPSRIRDFLASL